MHRVGNSGGPEAVARDALFLTCQLVLIGTSAALLTVPVIVGGLLHVGGTPRLLIVLWVALSMVVSGLGVTVCRRTIRSVPWSDVSAVARRMQLVLFSTSLVHGFAMLLVPHHRDGRINPVLFAVMLVFSAMAGGNVLLGFGDKDMFFPLAFPILGFSGTAALQLGGFVGLTTAVGTVAYVAVMFAVNRLAGNAFTESSELRLRNEALVVKLESQVRLDPLTGISNRLGLWHEVERRKSEQASHGDHESRTSPDSVLYLDLNGFKPINDAHGHSVGDKVLKVVADRLSTCSRAGDVVARMGGDEFVVVAANASVEEAQALVDRLSAALSEPIMIDGVEVRISASIGLARSVNGDSLEQTLICADQRMYEMKRLRRLPA